MQILLNPELLTWCVAGISYVIIVINICLYIFFLRHIELYRRESKILFFQIKSMLALIVISGPFAFYIPIELVLIGLAASIFTHAIYSLIFLELWALSQGSFSLETLKHIKLNGLDVNSRLALTQLGNHKLASRILNLRERGIILSSSENWVLTTKGRVAYVFLKLIQLISATRKPG